MLNLPKCTLNIYGILHVNFTLEMLFLIKRKKKERKKKENS